MTVSEPFDTFLANIALTSHQRSDGGRSHGSVRSTLNRNYYGVNSETANSMLVGAWGKDTMVRPPRNIDVMFVLPYTMYRRFEKRLGNKQAQLLLEVKDVLQRTYATTTTMRADGQAIIVSFGGHAVEVVPAFLLESTQYWICDTNDGGKFRTIDPVAELGALQASDLTTGGKTRDLIRMMKIWQRVCSVPLKSVILDLLVIEFLNSYEDGSNSPAHYDRMVRDFFAFLLTKNARSYVVVPGTGELIWLNAADWISRAEAAHGYPGAGQDWQKIFGGDMPAGS